MERNLSKADKKLNTLVFRNEINSICSEQASPPTSLIVKINLRKYRTNSVFCTRENISGVAKLKQNNFFLQASPDLIHVVIKTHLTFDILYGLLKDRILVVLLWTQAWSLTIQTQTLQSRHDASSKCKVLVWKWMSGSATVLLWRWTQQKDRWYCPQPSSVGASIGVPSEFVLHLMPG